MSNNNEGTQDPKDVIPDEETRKDLEEMQKEGSEVPALDAEEGKDKVDKSKELDTEEKTEKVEVKEEKVFDFGEEEKEEKEEKPDGRVPTMMPAWRHKKAEKDWSKKETDLLAEIETLKNKPSSDVDAPDLEENINKLAKEKGVDAELIKSIVNLRPQDKSSEEIKTALAELGQLKQSQQLQAAESQFKDDFGNLLSVIKAEHPDISDGDLSKIQSKLRGIAFSEGYTKVPVETIYKGVDMFRGVKGKKTMESAKGGQGRTVATDDFASWSEDDLKSASNEQAEKYFAWVEKNKG